MIALTIKFKQLRESDESEAPAVVPKGTVRLSVGGRITISRAQLWKGRNGIIVSIDPTNRYPLELLLDPMTSNDRAQRTRCSFNEVDPVVDMSATGCDPSFPRSGAGSEA